MSFLKHGNVTLRITPENFVEVIATTAASTNSGVKKRISVATNTIYEIKIRATKSCRCPVRLWITDQFGKNVFKIK